MRYCFEVVVKDLAECPINAEKNSCRVILTPNFNDAIFDPFYILYEVSSIGSYELWAVYEAVG